MDTVETILNGDKEEFEEAEHLFRKEDELNSECYIHYTDSTEIPEYIEIHERRRIEAELQNLELDINYGAEPKSLY